MKKTAAILICTATVGLLGGCGNSFDAAAYTQALLDNSYKNDSTQFVSTKVGTAEEASKLYEEGVEMQVNTLLAAVNATEEQEAEYHDVIADILAGAKYTVGEAEKQDDNSYVVTVTCERMNIFSAAADDYMAQYEAQYEVWMEGEEVPSEEEMTEWYIETMKNCLSNAFASATYDAPEETTIRIELINKVYTPNSSDLLNLTNSLFDSE